MESPTYGLVALAVIIVIFLLCREALCWYWKINKMHAQLERQTTELASINARLGQLVDLAQAKKTQGVNSADLG